MTRRLSRAGMPFLTHLLLRVSAITWLLWLVFSKASPNRICPGLDRLWEKAQLSQDSDEAKELTTWQTLTINGVSSHLRLLEDSAGFLFRYSRHHLPKLQTPDRHQGGWAPWLWRVVSSWCTCCAGPGVGG